MAKILGLKQLTQKQYKLIDDLCDVMKRSFGQLPTAFIMIVWGASGNGKSNFLMQFLKAIMHIGNVLYLGLEEGHEASMQQMALRHFDVNEHGGQIQFANHELTYELLVEKLKKKKSPKIIVIDSLQYWHITYIDYQKLKELFPSKVFIFISHAKGKSPDGKTADKIRYDAGIKVRVEGYVAHVISRYGGNRPYIIWEEGAVRYYKRRKVNEFKK